MAIAAGTLTERITLQKATVTRNSIGEEVAGWTDIITGLPAAVRWLKGSRALTFGDVWNPATVKITCRYREAFEEAERILWHGKEFTVVSAFGDRVNMNMTITADLYHEGKNADDEPEPPVPVYLTAWKIVGNSEVHTDPFLTSWKVSGNSVVQDGDIMSCGDLGQDGKYHVKISNGATIYDIPLTEPLRKVGDVSDKIEFANNAAIVTRNIATYLLSSTPNWLRWTATVGKRYISSNVPLANAVLPRSTAVVGIGLCSIYTIISVNSAVSNKTGLSIENADGRIGIYDADYAENETNGAFVEHIQGAELLYQLATPTTELINVSPFPVSPTDTYTSANVTPYSAFEHT